MRILGVSAFYHDSAAVLLVDGEIVAAAQEERFTRSKNDERFPASAIRFCLEKGGLRPEDIDAVAFYEKPLLKFDRILETYFAFAPRGFRFFHRSFPLWMKEKLFQKKLLIDGLEEIDGNVDWVSKLQFCGHHQSHAASAFFASPLEEALVLTMDGVGEWTTTSIGIGTGRELELVQELRFPHSLGLLYSAFTYHCGFEVNSGEYKLMGLAPYGVPRFKETIEGELIDVKPDGSFRLNLKYFDYCTDLKMTNRKFSRLFGIEPRKPGAPLTQEYKDLAASAQAVTEEVIFKLAAAAQKTYAKKNLCLAGGVALNSVANGKLLKSGLFERVWVQPAAGDAGGALGAALVAHHIGQKKERRARDLMRGALLGPAYSDEEIKGVLDGAGAVYESLEREELLDRVVSHLAEGHVLGWFQGQMEFGPRALGARSILADPRLADAQSRVNLKVKFRESFRPFAGAVLESDAGEWFNSAETGPYMQFVVDVREEKRGQIPAITHVDDSCRIQTVGAADQPLFHDLLLKFKARTGCPVLLNTSFNIKGEPIVCSPEDAYRSFMASDLDALAMGRFFAIKPGCKLRGAP